MFIHKSPCAAVIRFMRIFNSKLEASSNTEFNSRDRQFYIIDGMAIPPVNQSGDYFINNSATRGNDKN
jgi:hypothetical protein